MVEAWRTHGRETSDARRDALSRRGPDATQMGDRVQGPWTIASARPWGLDIACREDDRRIRQGHAPAHFARLRPIAVHLRQHERTHTHGVQAKRNRAGWDHDDRLTVLGIELHSPCPASDVP
jgi:predicted transposase YbfD/YdcC